MKGSEAVVVVLIFLAIIALFVGLAFSLQTQLMGIKSEAIERGYAEWVINPSDGSTTWQWKEPTE